MIDELMIGGSRLNLDAKMKLNTKTGQEETD